MVIILIIVQYALFLISMVFLANYFIYPIPFVPYPSMLTVTNIRPDYIRNVLLYMVFWAQHIIMATLKYKISWLKSCKYFPLYDRYIYNIASGLCLWIMCAFL